MGVPMNRVFSAAVAACLLLVGAACAHPGGHDHATDLRVWNDIDGLFEIEASFVQAKDDQVQLCKHNGSIVWVPLGKLSANDRDWVRQKTGEIRTLNTPVESASVVEHLPPGTTLGHAVLSIVAVGSLVVLAFLAFALRRRPQAMKVLVPLFAVAGPLALLAIAQGPEAKKVPLAQKHFEPFKDKLQLHSDENFLYVGSDGFPDHPMMIGIKAWQQQVPIPQPFTGKNSWQIPLKPKLAEKPVSAKTALFRGAIALAVNGVPIFNALNNRGVDTLLAGELDEYGGHCGRGDDYHYHIAPVHLDKVAGKGNPIAYALDGFPIYGYTDAEGKEPKDLDEFNGRMEKDGYRYYSTKKFPYINGGMRGEVTVRNDGIEPQPRDAPIRPAGLPLRGAKIIDFTRDDEKKTYTLKYELAGKTLSWKYTINKDDTYTFVYTDAAGKATTETYRRRERKDDQPPKKDGPPKKDNPPKKDGPPPPRPDGPPMKEELPAPKPVVSETFKLTSPAFEAGGKLPVEFSGDGDGISPPLAWSGAPAGTKCYALQLWHIPGPGEVKSYWVIYNIPANVSKLEKGSKTVGVAGYNDKNRTDYDPMKSKGPGAKEYHITMYALSAEPKFQAEKVTRADLLKAIKDITLAETTLSYKFERFAK